MDHNFKPKPDLLYLGFPKNQSYYYQLSPDSLIRYSLEHKEGILTNMGALAVDTGEFKGRSPKDRFIVKDALTATQVWWGETNIPFTSSSFDRLYKKVIKFLSDKTLFVRDAKARSGEQGHAAYRAVAQDMHRLIAEHAGHRLIAEAMTFVDHASYDLERLESERRAEARRSAAVPT